MKTVTTFDLEQGMLRFLMTTPEFSVRTPDGSLVLKELNSYPIISNNNSSIQVSGPFSTTA